MNKNYKKLLFYFFVFVLFAGQVNARNLNLKELVKRVDPKSDTIYVIGTHAFGAHTMTLEDVMVGARTISIQGDDHFDTNYTEDDVYKAMNIYKISITKDEDFNVVGATVTGNLVGTSKLELDWNNDQKTIEVDNINYDYVKEESKATIELYNSSTHSEYQSWFNGKQFTTNDYVTASSMVNGTLPLSGVVMRQKEQKYSIGLVVKVTEANKMTENATIWYGKENDKSKATKQTKNDFLNNNSGLPILFDVLENDNKKLYIWVDLDGEEGSTYEATPYLVDYSTVSFETDSVGEVKVDKEFLQKDLSNLESEYHYVYPVENNWEIKDNQFLGDVTKQDNVTLFKEDEATGYYIAFNVSSSYFESGKTTVYIPCKSENEKCNIKGETLKISEKFNDRYFKKVTLTENNLAVIFSINEETKNSCSSDNSKCLIPIIIDSDGPDNHKYSNVLYALDYSKVNLHEISNINLSSLESSQYQVTQEGKVSGKIETENTKKYYFQVSLNSDNLISGKTTIEVVDPNQSVKKYTYNGVMASAQESDKVEITSEENKINLKLEALKPIEMTDNNSEKKYVVTIDMDGAETKYLPSTYTIDYTKLLTLEEEINHFADMTQSANDLVQDVQNKENETSENYKIAYNKEKEVKLITYNEPKEVSQIYYFAYKFPTENIPDSIKRFAGQTIHFAFSKYPSKVDESKKNEMIVENEKVYINGWEYMHLSVGFGVDILNLLQDEIDTETSNKIRAIENIEKQSSCEDAMTCYKVTLTKEKVEAWLNNHYSLGKKKNTVDGPKEINIKVDQEGYVKKVESVGEWETTYKADESSAGTTIKRTINVTIKKENVILQSPEEMIIEDHPENAQELLIKFIAKGDELWQKHI